MTEIMVRTPKVEKLRELGAELDHEGPRRG